MAFDFARYLAQYDSANAYVVERLVGGVINETVRASAELPCIAAEGGTLRYSMILKHATPYVAAVGPEAVIDQSRQTTEATVLGLFGTGPLADIKDKDGVSLPALLFHDRKNHVLAMSDLGRLSSLSDIFSELGGFTPHASNYPVRPSWTQHHEPHVHQPYYFAIGKRLGAFLARLHSRRTLSAVLSAPLPHANVLSDPAIHASVHEYAIKPLQEHLHAVSDLLPSFVEPAMLFDRLEADWLRPTLPQERSFIMGDCWTGSVLLTLPPVRDLDHAFVPSEPDLDVCLIDFEFASITRGVHGDVPQLLAHLEVFLHVARFHRSEYHIQALETTITSFVQAYRTVATHVDDDQPFWMAEKKEKENDLATDENVESILLEKNTQHRHSREPFPPPDARSLKAIAVRSGLLALAGEMMNTAFWKLWPCLADDCPATLAESRSDEEVVEDGVASDDCHLDTNYLVDSAPDLHEKRWSAPPIVPSVPTKPKKIRRPSFQTYAASHTHRHSASSLSSSKLSCHDSSISSTSMRRCFHLVTSDMKGDGGDTGFPSVHTAETAHLCPLIRSIMRDAIWLTVHAGETTVQMCASDNWKDLIAGPAGWLETNKSGEMVRRKWYLDLFR